MISPICPLQLPSSLSLNPRLKLTLTFFRTDPSVKPIDEWQLKLSLLTFLRCNLSIPFSDESDLSVTKLPNLNKRKRDDPVATGVLYVRNLSFLKGKDDNENEDDEKVFKDWKSKFLAKLEHVEFNIEGVGFVMRVAVPIGEDFDDVKKSWVEYFRLSRGIPRGPDTIIIKGIPSRWFAETRVSSKPSMLVSHTIFSALGKIRNLNIAEDDDQVNSLEETTKKIVSGLACKVWIRFDDYDSFCNAMKVLCGRSLQKEGSRLKVDYEVNWDRNGYFDRQSSFTRTHVQEKTTGYFDKQRTEGSRHYSHITPAYDVPHAKRFREL